MCVRESTSDGLMVLPPQRSALHANQFQGSQTNKAKVGVFNDLLQTWGIQKCFVHVAQEWKYLYSKQVSQKGVSNSKCDATRSMFAWKCYLVLLCQMVMIK